MKELNKHLRFQPHGDNLLTQSAAFWLISARILVFILALAEGVSWARLGYMFGDGATRWIGAFLAGGAISIVVFIVDVSLVTIDRAWSEHSVKLLGEQPESVARRRFRDGFTFLFRVLLLSVSLAVSAPFLAQLVFSTDIEQFISKEGVRAVNAGRQALAEQYDGALKAKGVEIAGKRTEYEAETSGKGQSGRYGDGPAAKAKLQTVEKLEGERAELSLAKEGALRQFNELSVDWHANRGRLEELYSIELPRTSIMKTREALDELQKRPENQQTEWAVRAFIAIIFGGLILLKLFEPRSVRLYMSEVLQQEYLRYKVGTFDRHLLPGEESTNDNYKIPPQRLYAFLLETWRPLQRDGKELQDEVRRKRITEETRARNESLCADERRLKEQAMTDRLNLIQHRIRATQNSLALLTKQYDRAGDELRAEDGAWRMALVSADEADRSFADLNATIDNVQKDIAYFDNELVGHEDRKLGLDEKGSADIAQVQNRLREKRGDANHGLSILLQARGKERRSLDRALATAREAEERRIRALQRRDELREQMEVLERQISHEALEAGTSILSAQLSLKTNIEVTSSVDGEQSALTSPLRTS